MGLLIVVACEDAGGAAALAPVVKRLFARGDRMTFLLGEVAAATLRARGIDIELRSALSESDAAQRIEGAWSGVSALVTATSRWGLRLEARATVAARRAGVPSLGLIDFWSNYEARLSYPCSTGLTAMPDQLAVIDTLMREELVSIGANPERLIVTGSPAFDEAIARGRAPHRQGEGVLFLSQPLAVLYGIDSSSEDFLGYTERTVLSTLALAISAAGSSLVVRPHPREDALALGEFVQSLPCAARIDARGTLAEAVASARLVVGMTTVALVEAALLGAPVISAQLDRRSSDPLPTNQNGLTIGVTDAGELIRLVQKALLGDNLSAKSSFPWEEGATDRVLAALDRLTSMSEPGSLGTDG